MPAADYRHSPTPEEVMEYLDGEGSIAARNAIAAHLAECDTCQVLAGVLRGVSREMDTWRVEPAPSTLRGPLPAATRRRGTHLLGWRVPRAAVVALGAAAVLIVILSVPGQRHRAPAVATAKKIQASPGDAAAPPIDAIGARSAVGGLAGGSAAPVEPRTSGKAMLAGRPSEAPVRAPAVIRTATLRIVARNFTGVRETVEGVVTQAGGFIDQLTVTGDTGNARGLRGTLRIPADRLSDTLGRLRQIGQVLEDTQGSQDVTDQIVDLSARLASARATEARLIELLRNRTGRLSDVLEVERELTRVRLEIERLDAERTNVGRRVSYAAVDVYISEERKAGLEGPLSLSTRLRVAAADGLEAALESVTATALFVLRAGPTLLLWAAVAATAWWLTLRRRTLRIRD